MPVEKMRRNVSAIEALALVTALFAFVASASHAFAESAKRDPVAAQTFVDQGVAQFESGKYADAEASFTQARALDPSASVAPLYLGLIYEKQGRLSEAIGAWRNYVTIEPSGAEDANLQKTMREEYLPNVQRALDHQEATIAIKHEVSIGPGDPHTLAITYYQNLGSPEYTPYKKGLAALLIADAFKVPGLTVVTRAHLQALIDEMQLANVGLVDPKTAARVGKLAGAGLVNTGSFNNPSANEVKIDSLTARTSPAQIVNDTSVSGHVDQIFVLEKQLLIADLGALGYDQKSLEAAGIWTDLQKPQTTSLPALKAFSAGLDAKDAQNYVAAKADMQQALALDPNFELPKQELLDMPAGTLTIAQIDTGVSAAARGVIQNKFSQATLILASRQGLPSCPNSGATVTRLSTAGVPVLPAPMVMAIPRGR